MTVLDADFLIAVSKRVPAAMELAEQLEATPTTLLVPAAAWTEYLVGVPPAKRPDAGVLVHGSIVFMPFGRAEVGEAVRIADELGSLGRALAWHDLQVAATARSLGEPLVSNDQAFGRVPGLQVMRF